MIMKKILDNLKRGFIFTVSLPFVITYNILAAPFRFGSWLLNRKNGSGNKTQEDVFATTLDKDVSELQAKMSVNHKEFSLKEINKTAGQAEKEEIKQDEKPRKLLYKILDAIDLFVKENQNDKEGLEVARVLKDSLKYVGFWYDKDYVATKDLIKFIPHINGYKPEALIKSIEAVAGNHKPANPYNDKREGYGHRVANDEVTKAMHRLMKGEIPKQEQTQTTRLGK